MSAQEYYIMTKNKKSTVWFEGENGEKFEQSIIMKPKPVENAFERKISINQTAVLDTLKNLNRQEKENEESITKIKENNTMSDKEKKTEIQKIKDSNIHKNDLMVLMYLIGKADFDNYVKVSQKEIADELGMRQPHVSRSFKKLRECGFISTDKQFIRLDLNFAWKGFGYKHKAEVGKKEIEDAIGKNHDFPDNLALA